MENYDDFIIYNERGILKKENTVFHTPSEFAAKNLFYTIWSGKYTCSGKYSVRREFLDYYSIIYVVQGQMELIYNQKTYVIPAGNIVLMDFRKPHYYHATSDYLVKWEMLFNGNASSQYCELIINDGSYIRKTNRRLDLILKKLQTELLSSVPNDHRISCLIHELLSNIYLKDDPSLSPPVQTAVEYIRGHYAEPLRIDDLAIIVSLSKHYFSRLFLKETGYSPHAYLINYRIQEAKEMLTEQKMSVAEIGEACGFVNTSHFVRVFRANVGQTPAAFRNTFNIL